jgi:hypothetical protein
MTRFAPTTRFEFAQMLAIAMSVAMVVFTWLPTISPAAV